MKRITLSADGHTVLNVELVPPDAPGVLVSPTFAVGPGDRVQISESGEVTLLPPPLPPLPVAKEAALAALADQRWQASQRFVYQGVETWAEPAITNVTAKVVALQAINDVSVQTTWKLSNTEFRQWSFNELVMFGLAVNTYVQKCFVREAALSAAIEACVTAEQVASVPIFDGWAALRVV